MTTENENIKDEQEEKPTKKKSNSDRMREALEKAGFKIVEVNPPKGFVQVIFRR
jgi:predicted CoA-binding protein